MVFDEENHSALDQSPFPYPIVSAVIECRYLPPALQVISGTFIEYPLHALQVGYIKPDNAIVTLDRLNQINTDALNNSFAHFDGIAGQVSIAPLALSKNIQQVKSHVWGCAGTTIVSRVKMPARKSLLLVNTT